MKRKVVRDEKLREFLERGFITPKLAGGIITKETAIYYRTVLNLYECFTGRDDLNCSDVSGEALDRFVIWLLDHQYQRTTATQYRQAVAAVVSRWNPGHLRSGSTVGNRGVCLNFNAADEKGTLEEVCLHRYLPQNPKTTSQQSYRMYGLAIRYFGEFLGRPATLDDLEDESVARYLRWLVDVRGNKPITANGYAKRIKALWTWCAKKRIVAEFPTVANLPIPETFALAWNQDELRQLIAACPKQPGRIGGIVAADYWLALHLVLWDSGDRSGAVLQLRWAWLDWKTGILAVPPEVRKGMKADLHHYKPATLAALQAIRSPRRELIFELPWKSRSSFYHHYKKLVKSAGLPYLKGKCGPQRMRRSYASYIEAAGGNATKALRHTDRRVTERSYLDPRIVETEPANAKLFPLAVS